MTHKTNFFNINADKLIALKFIYQEIATRMLERMDYIKINPEAILDIGSGLNIDSQLLKQHYPNAQVYSLDFAIQILKHYAYDTTSDTTNLLFKKILNLNIFKESKQKHKNAICADALHLPLKSQSIDLVWSNLTLPHINSNINNTLALESYFKEIQRVLKIGGMFLITGLGRDSFKELRAMQLTIPDFPDMHVIGDILVKCGFNNPVTDTEYLTIEYDNINDLINDIKLIGFDHLLIHENASSYKPNQNNKFPLTLEVFYAHGFKDKIHLDLADNQKIIQFNPQIRHK